MRDIDRCQQSATLGIVCGAQVPKCEPARVASRRNVWGTRCERSDVSCETLCRCACALVDCVSKCVTKKQWQQAMRTRPWTNRRPSRGHPCGSVTVLMAVSTRGYSGGGLCERSSRAVVPRADTASPPWSHGSIIAPINRIAICQLNFICIISVLCVSALCLSRDP